MDQWRRGWDSNPRTPVKMLLEFQSSAFDRSATSPFNVLQVYLKVDRQCCSLTLQSLSDRLRNSNNRLGQAPTWPPPARSKAKPGPKAPKARHQSGPASLDDGAARRPGGGGNGGDGGDGGAAFAGAAGVIGAGLTDFSLAGFSGIGLAKKFGGCARHGSVLARPRSAALSSGILTALRVSGALRPSGTLSGGRESALPANGRSWQATEFLPPR